MTKRILWASPFALHDTSSGAAMHCRTMLEKLKELAGDSLEIFVLGSFIFDNPRGASMFADLKEKLAGKEQFFNLDDHGIRYCYVRSANTYEEKYTSGEQRQFFTRFVNVLHEFRPDLLMGYGGDCLSMAMRAEAHRRGIPTVYNLQNGNHKGFTFPDCEMVLTDSKASAEFYGRNFGINVMTSGPFIRKETVVAEKREPRYVTLVNPAPEKGVSIFARLALMAQQELPEVRFLVVESRGSFSQAVQKLYALEGKGRKARQVNPFKPDMFPNVDVAQHTNDMRQVYAITKVLLAPSLWFENWGRVATEAVMNGIPVLGSKSGGLPEAIGEGGVTLDAPSECQKDYSRIPTEDEVRPWLEALKQMLSEDYTERCAKAAALHDADRSAGRVLELITPLLNRAASTHPQYYRGGMLFR